MNIFLSFSHSQSNKYKEEIERKINKESEFCINFSEKMDRLKYDDENIWSELQNIIAKSFIMFVIYSPDLIKGSGGKACKIKDNWFAWNDDSLNEGWIYKEIKLALKTSYNKSSKSIALLIPEEYKENYEYNMKNRNIPNIILGNFNNKKSFKKEWDLFQDSYIPHIHLNDFYKNTLTIINQVYKKRENYDDFHIITN